ncbi:hypothetical protein [Kribbella catacumbae]|uniref:hypothetical protein n=1 Tax=Kribbella catacumbae TaxID=460086 RepID=UPI0003829C38|nr:hypothetical protein [Kribbella catacumbae]
MSVNEVPLSALQEQAWSTLGDSRRTPREAKDQQPMNVIAVPRRISRRRITNEPVGALDAQLS